MVELPSVLITPPCFLTKRTDEPSPFTKVLLDALSKKISSKSDKERDTPFSHVKTIHRKLQMEPQLNSKVPLSTDPINNDAFHYYSPKSNAIPAAMRGKSCAEYRAQINTKYNSDANADRIRRLAVNNNVNAIFEAEDDDQIALALMHTLRHRKVKLYMNRVIAPFNSERA